MYYRVTAVTDTLDGQAVPGDPVAVDADVSEVPLGDAFSIHAAGPRKSLQILSICSPRRWMASRIAEWRS
jgi:hypothetical protein